MAADTLRELAQQYPELLTRECECLDRSNLHISALDCVACHGTGRRLATLEELLEAIAGMRPSFARKPWLARCNALRIVAGYIEERGGCDDEITDVTEAAARALIDG